MLTDLIDIAFPILNVKLADLAMFWSSWTKISSCCNSVIWLMPPINEFEVFESISNAINSMLLYYELENELKI